MAFVRRFDFLPDQAGNDCFHDMYRAPNDARKSSAALVADASATLPKCR